MLSRTAVLSLAAGASVAYGIQISPQCQSTLTALVTSPDAACLNPIALVPIAIKNDTDIVAPINNWLTGLCAVAPCSNATIASIVANVTAGCATDLSINSTDTAGITAIAQKVYPTVRKVVCLRDTAKAKFCLTEELLAAEDVLGVLNLANFDGIVAKLTRLEDNHPNITCTNCIKQAYNIIHTDFPASALKVKDPLTNMCGNNFTDGNTPSDVVQAALGEGGNSSSSASAGASSTGSAGSSKPTGGAIAVGSGSAISFALTGLVAAVAFLV